MHKTKTALLMFLSCLCIYSQAWSASYSLTNMGPDFKDFVKAYRLKTPDERWVGWKSFEGKYTKFYDAGICKTGDVGCETLKRSRLDDFFKKLPTFETSMWAMFDRADEISSAQITQFRKTFPNLGADIPVVFMPSLLGFNGRAVEIQGLNNLLIAPDSLLNRADDVSIVFSHEFFHVYQFNRLSGKKIFWTMSSYLWFEGFATWVSMQQNPGASDSAALVDFNLGRFCAERSNVQLAASEFTKFTSISLNDPKAEEVYTDWFLTAGKSNPKRRGYCLGLQLFDKLTSTLNFADLVDLDEAAFSPYVSEGISSMAAGK